ncbi:HNH endonuclease [Nitratireductor sp.]|uniref:HNH endonuclease n=1 Tax=Nitratireductor sp. TaxID=1872084 RepID=UPI00260AC507|nr:HNH endonuclease [Nitratireductor sp.]MCV0381769.1 HNH endonuclease [Nitratireductor sp.]
MAKLTSLKPRIGVLASRIGYAPGDEKGRDRKRSKDQPWRAWYKTARWERLRQSVFVRDQFTCQRTGALCTGKGNHPATPVANHKVPHRGDPALFWDPDNLETVTKQVHDSIIQREERRADLHRVGGGSKV